mmetsp:Transcript_8445/g.25615  ORF Transcript_8445/g.25615 Transcript_8445/m.25615 type:complete len:204 (-) Transcript_8445:397-1008(-)
MIRTVNAPSSGGVALEPPKREQPEADAEGGERCELNSDKRPARELLELRVVAEDAAPPFRAVVVRARVLDFDQRRVRVADEREVADPLEPRRDPRHVEPAADHRREHVDGLERHRALHVADPGADAQTRRVRRERVEEEDQDVPAEARRPVADHEVVEQRGRGREEARRHGVDRRPRDEVRRDGVEARRAFFGHDVEVRRESL